MRSLKPALTQDLVKQKIQDEWNAKQAINDNESQLAAEPGGKQVGGPTHPSWDSPLKI